MKWIAYYFLFQLTVLFILILISKRKDKRYNPEHTYNHELTKTDEIIRDPINGKKIRVYLDSSSGKRIYREEE